MTQTMKERIARVLCRQNNDENPDVVMGDRTLVWTLYADDAAEILQALREPNHWLDLGFDDHEVDVINQAIDAALQEKA